MHPVLFEIGSLKVYSYGFMIAVGALLGVIYLGWQGKREVGMTIDQTNSLFLLIFIAAFVGGKFFLFFENPSLYAKEPIRLISGRGFVFYGSFLFAVPAMWWFFKKHKLPIFRMLDIMAVTTCLVHMFGRLGCFMAGCCYGIPTQSSLGVIFTDPACSADPLNTPLHPTQLYEASFILVVLIIILLTKKYFQKFYGQLFLMYLLFYAIGRSVIEIFRGDEVRGFIIDGYVSHSQLIAAIIVAVVVVLYVRWSARNKIVVKN